MSFVVELVGGPSDGHQMRLEELKQLLVHVESEAHYRRSQKPPVMRTFQPSLLHPPVSAPVWLYDYQPPERLTR